MTGYLLPTYNPNSSSRTKNQNENERSLECLLLRLLFYKKDFYHLLLQLFSQQHLYVPKYLFAAVVVITTVLGSTNACFTSPSTTGS